MENNPNWLNIHQFKELTPFGTWDIINHLQLLDKYPNDADLIERQMNEFYSGKDYEDEIGRLFNWYKDGVVWNPVDIEIGVHCDCDGVNVDNWRREDPHKLKAHRIRNMFRKHEILLAEKHEFSLMTLEFKCNYCGRRSIAPTYYQVDDFYDKRNCPNN